MAWFKVDDGWWSHPKTLALSDSAIALWTRAGSYSCQHLTDGFVAVETLRTLGKQRKVADELVRAGYWDVVDGGWAFHDWEDYQEHSETVKKRRADARDRMRTVRANKQRTVRDGSQEVPSTPTRPDPTRPITNVTQFNSGGTTGAEPPLKCPKHAGLADSPKCGACGDARRQHDQWQRAQKTKPTPTPPSSTELAAQMCPKPGHGDYPLPCDLCDRLAA